MSDVRFGALQDTMLNRAAYKVGTQLFTLPNRVAERADRFVAQRQASRGKMSPLDWLVKRTGNFSKQFLLNHEYQDVTDITVGRKRLFTAALPPKGAMVLWLFPGTILPRALRAYERGKENGGDYREVGDVLRRDFTAITLVLFMLDPLLERLNKIKQKFDGLEIVDRQTHKVLTYRQFDNYKLVNKQVLIRLLEEGNGRGLLKAAREMLHERGLERQVGSTALAKHVAALKQMIPELVAAHDRGDHATRERLAEQVIKHIKDADALTADAYEKARLGGTPKMVKQLENLQGSFENIVKQYAKTRRLPIDILGFAIMVGLIGFAPVWFNSIWNKLRFEKKLQEENLTPAAPPRINPLTFQRNLVGNVQVAGNPFNGLQSTPF